MNMNPQKERMKEDSRMNRDNKRSIIKHILVMKRLLAGIVGEW